MSFTNISTPIQRIASGAVSGFQAVRTTTSGNVLSATTSLRSVPFNGLSISPASNGNPVTVQEFGLVSPSIFNLGDGYACAVGTTVAGFPVRATDVTCVSAPNWLGHCDAHGNITIAPVRANNFNVVDFGAAADHVTDDSLAFKTAITAANADASGATVFVPRGRYYINQTANDLGAFNEGVRITGEGYCTDVDGGSVLEFHGSSGSGLWVWREYASNSSSNIVVEKLSIRNMNASNLGGTVTDGYKTLSIQLASNTSPITIVTDQDHGWSNGQSVTVAGVRGCTTANGVHTITVSVGTNSAGKRTFTLNTTTGNGQFVSGGAGVEMGGGGSFFVRDCQFAGWQYNIICDGTNGVDLRDTGHNGSSGSGITPSYGIWCTNANERITSAGTWAVADNTNLVFIENCYFNNPTTQIKSGGGVTHHIFRCLFNCGTGWSWDIDGTQECTFAKNYIEGNTNSGPIAGVIRLGNISEFHLLHNFGAIGGTTGAPLIQGIGSNNVGINIDGNQLSIGTASGIFIGSATFARISLSANDFGNTRSAVLFDTEVAASYLSAACQNPETSNKFGFGTVKPQFGIDFLDQTALGWGIRSPYGGTMLSHRYANVSEATQWRRGIFSHGNSGTFNSGGVDGFVYLVTAASGTTSVIPDVWTIPTTSLSIWDIDVIGCDTADPTKYCVFRKQLVITRAGAGATVQSTDNRDTPKNTDSFTSPTFGFDGSNNLQVTVTGQAGYAVQWVCRVQSVLVTI